jgi:hypothetical protein
MEGGWRGDRQVNPISAFKKISKKRKGPKGSTGVSLI